MEHVGDVNDLERFLGYSHIPKDLACSCTASLMWRIDPFTFALVSHNGEKVQYYPK